jgi:nucleotide-binding universal stress UspA family protein
MKPRKIIWAVDPFASLLQLQRSAALTIRSIQEGSRKATIVQPVYFSVQHPRSIPRAALPSYHKTVASDASDRLKQISKKIHISHLKPMEVIPSNTHSVKQLTDALLSYANAENADLIVVSSRTRKGPSRWFMGSFAETLLLYSSIPVMVVNPTWKNRGSRFHRVLYPTDFSEASYLAFLDVLPLIERWNAKLLIFHKVTYELQSVAKFAVVPNFEHFQKEAHESYLKSLRDKAETWQLEAKHYGVNSSVQFDYSTSGKVADRILNVAKRKAEVIAIAATSGIKKTKFLGSVTRRIIRESPCPVWVLRPSREKEKRNDSKIQIESRRAA